MGKVVAIACPSCMRAHSLPSWDPGTHASLRCHCGTELNIEILEDRRLLGISKSVFARVRVRGG